MESLGCLGCFSPGCSGKLATFVFGFFCSSWMRVLRRLASGAEGEEVLVTPSSHVKCRVWADSQGIYNHRDRCLLRNRSTVISDNIGDEQIVGTLAPRYLSVPMDFRGRGSIAPDFVRVCLQRRITGGEEDGVNNEEP